MSWLCSQQFSSETANDCNTTSRLPMAKDCYRLVLPKGEDLSRCSWLLLKIPRSTSSQLHYLYWSYQSSFARFGIQETVVSDNGPQYTSHEFTEFARLYGFQHTTSSPLYPQSNGQIERFVQTVKKLIRESKDPNLVLLAYRTTPFPWCKLSPAELLMGRCLR